MKFRSFILLAVCILFSLSNVTAKDRFKYHASYIPAPLLNHSNAVLRNYTSTLERTGLKSATLKVKYAITILNKAGEKEGYLILPYQKSFSGITNISATIYDAGGKKIKSVKKDEILDVAADVYYSLYSDTRLIYFFPKNATYPYTVEYSYTEYFKETMYLPSWNIYPGYNVSVEKADFFLTVADNPLHKINFYVSDTSLHIKKSKDKGKIQYSLSVKNLLPIQKEEYVPNKMLETSVVLLSPEFFKIGGFEGSYKNWNAYGNFIARLNRGRDELNEDTRNKIKELINDKSSDEEIIRTLYQYMQNKVRYVSEQKGIGGWQPYKAEKVDELSYGDCKALTNYMKSLLKVAGITSYYTLVHAGKDADDILTDFPSNQFNHAILCVPVKKDTMWLECTDMSIPCGYIGSFTDDRNVLLVNEDSGGFLVRTPAYSKDINKRVRKTEVRFTATDADINIQTRYSGIYYDKMKSLYRDTYEHQKQKILSRLHLPTILLKDFHFDEQKSTFPQITGNIHLSAKGIFTKAGNRLVFTPFLFAKEDEYNFRQGKRKNDIYIKRETEQVDTIFFELSDHFKASSKPKEYAFQTKYGTYRLQLIPEKDRLICVRRLVVNKGRYPSSEWEDFKSFFKKVDAYDAKKTVIMKVM